MDKIEKAANSVLSRVRQGETFETAVENAQKMFGVKGGELRNWLEMLHNRSEALKDRRN